MLRSREGSPGRERLRLPFRQSRNRGPRRPIGRRPGQLAALLSRQAGQTRRLPGFRRQQGRCASSLLSADLGARRRFMASMTPGATAEARLPRKAPLGRETRADLLSEFEGLSGRSAEPGTARPALAKTRYSGPIGHDAQRLKTAPVVLLATSTSALKERTAPTFRAAQVSPPTAAAWPPISAACSRPWPDSNGRLAVARSRRQK